MKYVIVEKHGCEVAVLGSEVQDHSDLAGGAKVISAGRCRIGWNKDSQEIEVTIWGGSTSMKINSRLEDADIIQHTIEFEG